MRHLRSATPLALALLAGSTFAQATLTTHSPSGAAAITPDGGTIVGSSGNAWLWTEAGGIVSIGGQTAVALSDDASAVAGNQTGLDGNDGPARWTSVGGWQDLGGLPGQTPPGGSHGTSYDISADGSVVVGLGWYSNWRARGFRWDAVNGMVELPQLGTGSSRASAISGDGQWVGGFDEHSTGTRRAALWDSSNNETLLLARPENPDGFGEINKINSDGSVIVGSDITGLDPAAGFVWRAGQGVTNFGPLPGVDAGLNYNFANAASEDGSIAVGGNWDLLGNTTYATIWTEATGVLFLSDYLTARGATGLDNIQLANAIDISADGQTILGWGVEFPFTFVWWTATIPNPDGGSASFCVTSANSVGSGALMASNGNLSVSANSLELSAGPVPNQPGLFYFGGTSQAPTAFGDGQRCVGGGQPTFRLPVSNGSGNTLSTALDFTSGSAAQLLPGSTWHFQAWYRDPAAGGTGFNLSDGLSVTFGN